MTPAISASKSQRTAKLQHDIQQNMPKFEQYSVALQLNERFWFSNEFEEGPFQEMLQLANSYAQLPARKSLSEYRVAIVTGEGGLLQGWTELADSCDMTLQVDCDSLVLQFQACLIAECRKAEKYTDKQKVLELAIQQLRSINPEITEWQIKEIREQFHAYTIGMKNNLFSSPERFEQFKQRQDHPVRQICLNYFSLAAMQLLAEILINNDAFVYFFNISNVCDYPKNFYDANAFNDEVTGVDPAQHLQQLPFSKEAICAFCQLFGVNFFTATCQIDKMAERLYARAINRRDRKLKKLSEEFLDPFFIDLYAGRETDSLELQPATKIFQFFAEHPQLEDSEWILRLTAARLNFAEIEELRNRQEKMKTLCLKSLSHQQGEQSTTPPLLCRILDKITAEPTFAETDKPVVFATE